MPKSTFRTYEGPITQPSMPSAIHSRRNNFPYMTSNNSLTMEMNMNEESSINNFGPVKDNLFSPNTIRKIPPIPLDISINEQFSEISNILSANMNSNLN